jgi:hypothetical protein
MDRMVMPKDFVHFTTRADGFVAEVGCYQGNCEKEVWFTARGRDKEEAKRKVLTKLKAHRKDKHSKK